MSLYVIGDLHLCKGDPGKSMTIFSGWDDYQERIEKNWLDIIKPDDTIVLAGDISWGMSLQGAAEDFRFIERLPGTKIILKGNHCRSGLFSEDAVGISGVVSFLFEYGLNLDNLISAGTIAG